MAYDLCITLLPPKSAGSSVICIHRAIPVLEWSLQEKGKELFVFFFIIAALWYLLWHTLERSLPWCLYIWSCLSVQGVSPSLDKVIHVEALPHFINHSPNLSLQQSLHTPSVTHWEQGGRSTGTPAQPRGGQGARASYSLTWGLCSLFWTVEKFHCLKK